MLSWQYVTRAYGFPDDEGFKHIVVAFVCVGNPYPVIASEQPRGTYSLMGRPMVPGHDAHVTFVRRVGGDDSSDYFPADPRHWRDLEARRELFSEVVVAETAQVLPVAILRAQWTPGGAGK